ncbi:MAG TPA: hypothetical protein VHV57_12750 [Acidimicrobiales bacterium]|jgi:hypothetical protein|nr:hypothetical protein [Acidimicrobiales bacterium]
MVERTGQPAPDPLGKRALFWVPSSTNASGEGTHPAASSTVALPVGKRALYSGARAESDSVRATSDNPLVDRGTFTVECERCRQVSHIGVLDLLIFQFPFGGWLPRGQFDRRMTCPSCRKRAWCSITLRRS